jgi:pSer/pThr/pTyr-binding forkhead associated (FHA) protein
VSRYLLIHHSPERGEVRFELEPGATYRVGAKGDNDLVIPTNDVSRHHAILRVGNGTFHITDLNSKNGTFVNGERVADATVRCGDLISLSSAKLVVVEVSSGAYAMVPDPMGESDPVDELSEDTNAQAVVVPTEQVIRLFEEVVEAIPRGALAAPLSWAVTHLAVDAALLLYADRHGGVSLQTSAGDLGPWTTEGAVLAGVVREHAPETAGRTRVRHVSALGDELLVSRVDDQHVLVFRCGSAQPPLAEVRAVVVATSLALTAAGVGGRPIRGRPGLGGEEISGYEEGTLVGVSPGIASVRDRLAELASTGEPIVVVAEPGVGARAVALALHRQRNTGRAPAVELVCDSSMTHVAGGAGADDDDPSDPWVAARGGSLILLEADRLPSGTWTSVLERISGAGRELQVIATWRERSDGRDDLPTGLRRLRVPPLRERREDIPVLVSRWTGHDRLATWSQTCLQALSAYGWPDNLRELHAEIRRIQAVHPRDRAVEVRDLAPRIRGQASDAALDAEQLMALRLEDARNRFERWFVSRVLDDNHGNQTRTAERLGLSRAGLFRKLRRLGIRGEDHTG